MTATVLKFRNVDLNMIRIDYPAPIFRLRKENGIEQIFDELRKVWLHLTPEEWVRQNFIQYLVELKKYPPAYIAIEKTMRLGELKKRFDILVYDPAHQPWMMVECKEMNVDLGEKVLLQLLRYNISIPVKYLVITNGNDCIAYRRGEDRLFQLDEIPGYNQ